MINESGELLNKIANWDFTDALDEKESMGPVDAAIYKKLQDYFKNFFMHFEGISRISKQLNTVMQDFIQESGQVEQVAVFLNSGTKMQTQDIEKSLRLIGDFTDKINAIYGKSQEIISLAYDMENNNQGVRQSVDQLVSNQAKNDEAVNDIFNVIKNLIVKTQKIGEITSLINRISSETNLLGLNAKVEAVHAGAAGRGFSVVADEIQRLSKESKTASVDITDTIKSVTDEINLLEKVALKSQGAFKAQRDSVTDVNSAFEKNSEFIGTYISEQKNFNKSIEVIKGDEDILVKSISNIFTSVREVTATANEITSLTYDQNNTISLLGKLEDDLSGCVGAMKQKTDDIKVVKVSKSKKKIMIIYDFECEFFVPTTKEAIKAADTYNYEVEFYAPKFRGMDGINEMADFIDKAIETKVDGLVISPIDDTMISQKLKQISSLGTRIVFINSKLDNIDYVSYIQTNGLAAGAAAARVVMGAMGSQGEVIVNAWADTRISAIEDRRNGFVQEIKKNTKIDVHEVPVNSQPSPEEAERTIRSMLASYPNARFVFLTNCDWGILSANYMKKYHPNIEVITVDFTKDIQNLMSEGLIHYALGQRNYSWGSMAFNFLDKNFNKKPVQKYVDTGTYEVNRQNINIYKSMI
jgi:methyl-accepting chemotaxis protein/ABC-type sugar transport system substrate-binding protein